MPANLYYKTVFAATANATNTLTVLGETASALVPDQEIVVNVPIAKLQEAITWDATWVRPANDVLDADNLPTVEFKLSKLTEAMELDLDGATAEARFKAKYTEAGLESSFNDDSGASRYALQRWVMQASPMLNSQIETIPFEAIIKVQVGAVTATALSALTDPAATAQHDSDVMHLFEQGLAAGALGSEADNGSSGSFTKLAVGDSITVYVAYAITRTTSVLLDAAQHAGETKFILNDGTVINTDGLTEVGVPTGKTVAYKFVAAAAKQ